MLFVESLGAEVNGILDKNDKQSSDSDTSQTLVRDQLRYLTTYLQVSCYFVLLDVYISLGIDKICAANRKRST
jgi:hypothetical protein